MKELKLQLVSDWEEKAKLRERERLSARVNKVQVIQL